MEDIHNYKKRLEQALIRLERAEIIKENRTYIKEFSQFCVANGISAGKVMRYIDDLVILSKWANKDLKECNRKDIEAVILKLEQSSYAEWTKYGFKIGIRKFFTWIRNTEGYPEEVRWIKLSFKNGKRKLPEELVTEDEVKRMILTTNKVRDKALIAVLYESGCRIQEVLTIKIKSIIFDQYGAVINVSGKTGSRRVRLVFAVPYLQEWLNNHVEHDNPESYVWIGKKSKLISYPSVRKVLQRIAKKAGVNKKVNPHNFRHSRASYLANHLTESQLKEVFGWAQASKMASVYVHLSGRNTDEAILRVYGKKIDVETKKDNLVPKSCPRCKTENEATHKYCKLCGMILDEEERTLLLQNEAQNKDIDKVMNALFKDKDVLALVAQKIKEVKL
jgi:integrase/recombinase XerD